MYTRGLMAVSFGLAAGIFAFSGAAGLTGSLVAAFVIGILVAGMVDSSKVQYSVVPTSDWELRHSCLSAYFVAGQAASSGVNIYDNALYSRPSSVRFRN